jgi:hypothetical protein
MFDKGLFLLLIAVIEMSCKMWFLYPNHLTPFCDPFSVSCDISSASFSSISYSILRDQVKFNAYIHVQFQFFIDSNVTSPWIADELEQQKNLANYI